MIRRGAATSASEVARAGGDSVGRARGTSPASLAARLRGDLDAIVSQALAQDPARSLSVGRRSRRR